MSIRLELLIAVTVATLQTGAAVAETLPTRRHPVATRCSSTYVQASRLSDQADAAIARRDYVAANHMLDKGLAVLGAAYVNSRVLDDTSLQLAFARYHEKKGRLSNAAASKRTVLIDRLALCRK